MDKAHGFTSCPSPKGHDHQPKWMPIGKTAPIKAAIEAKPAEPPYPRMMATRAYIGYTKLRHEHINLTLPEGAKARMDAGLEDGEDRLDLIRSAIEREQPASVT